MVEDQIMLNAPRLILRDFIAEDLEGLYKIGTHPASTHISRPFSLDYAREYLGTLLHSQKQIPRTSFELAVVEKESREVVGSAGFRFLSLENREADLGCVLHPDFWNRGFAGEAAHAVLGFAFEVQRIHKMLAICDPENHPAKRVAERLGFTLEGKGEDRFLLGKWRPSVVYSLPNHQWRKSTTIYQERRINPIM